MIHYQRLENNFQDKPRSISKLINGVRKSSYPSSMFLKRSEPQKEGGISNLFGKYFATVYEFNIPNIPVHGNKNDCVLNSFQVSLVDVEY